MTMLTKILFAASMTLAAATTAQARDTEMVTARVSIADINLASQHGQQQLDRRIHRAATALCRDANAGLDMSVRRSERHCREMAKASAMAALADRTATRVSIR
jgi:UrcA family protein